MPVLLLLITVFNLFLVLDQDIGEVQSNVTDEPLQSNGETNEFKWDSYTPKHLKEPKSKKLTLKNKPSPKLQQEKTLLGLKQNYLEQKIQNLKNEEIRKQDRHNKEMELLEVEIKKKETGIQSNNLNIYF